MATCALLHASLGFAPSSVGSTLVTAEGFAARGFTAWEEAADAGPEAWEVGFPADPPCFQLFTFDFDGTTEFTDNLAHDVFDRATEEEKLTDLIPAYEKLKAEMGGTAAIVETYFDGPGRVAYFNKYVADLNKATGRQVFILSASWDPTPGAVWKAYMYHVLEDVGMPFPIDRIIGVGDPGPGIAADKGTPGMEAAVALGVPASQVLHVDNSFKYDTQFPPKGGNGLYPMPTPDAAPIQEADFKFMLAAANAC